MDIEQYIEYIKYIRLKILSSEEFTNFIDPKISIVSRLDYDQVTNIISKYLSIAILVMCRERE